MRDLTGQTLGRLTAIRPTEERQGTNIIWLCRCVCGKETKVSSRNLTSGNTQSCGCLQRERTQEANFKHGDTKKGKATRLYNVWHNMLQRCYNPRHPDYKYYGGRGVVMHDEWRDYLLGYVNYKDCALANGWKKGLELDRIDNNGNYEPRNIQFLTKSEHMKKHWAESKQREMECQIF